MFLPESLSAYTCLKVSLSHFWVTDIQLRNFFHLGFVNDLHPSSEVLSLSPFLSDLRPVKEFYHLGFVNDLHPSSGILSLSLFS